MLRVRFKLAEPRSIVERTIAAQDWPYLHSHVELQFSDGVSFSSRAFASGGGGIPNGTSFQNIEYDPSQWSTVEIPCSEADEAVVRRFCESQDGEQYDFIGVAAFKLWLLHQDPTKWFCSEVVCTAVQQIGYTRDLVPHRTSPDRLYSHLKAIFQ